MRKSITILAGIAILINSCKNNPYPENTTRRSLERAEALVKQMNIEQKASLMMHPAAPIEELGIPAYNWWSEALHGVARNGKATTFPQPIGMAASFDDDLILEVFTAVSDEARVKNRQAVQAGFVAQYQGLTFWTPNINIFRDPRWGRGMETYGEDPYLTGRLGVAVVKGLQGPSDAPVLKAHACAKHFAVHSGPEGSRHSFNAEVSERDLRETYLPAFKDLVTKADVQEVMIAYNSFRGYPCGASDYLVNTILRGQWGYKGIVLSDCWAIMDFVGKDRHDFSPDRAHAAAAAISNGVDLNCGVAYEAIPEAVADGILPEADVDRSLVRLMAARYRLGEMDGITAPWDHLTDDIVEGPAHLALARKMAQESIVLLQNNNDILPLDKDARVALMGPNANDREMQWGNYNPIPDYTSTLRDALETRMSGLTYVSAQNQIPEDCDIVLYAGGINPRLEGEEMPVNVPGFKDGDRTEIEFLPAQREEIARLKAAGKKVILINFSGSAMGLEEETRSCEAILQAWYPGEEGGNALADIILGSVAPSGKLPVTFYRNVGQLPPFEDYSMAGRTYRYFQGQPLFPFGFGLSYTTFSYGDAYVDGANLYVPVTNTGSRTATEVVQLYVRRPDDADGPLKSLRGFKRVTLEPGQTAAVALPLTDDTFLGWSHEAQDMVPLRGSWQLLYGPSSDSLKTLEFCRE